MAVDGEARLASEWHFNEGTNDEEEAEKLLNCIVDVVHVDSPRRLMWFRERSGKRPQL